MVNLPAVREEIPRYLNELGLVNRGVEVGVQRGDFSRTILDTWKGDKLYLVDIWRPIGNSKDPANVSLPEQRGNLLAAFDAITPYDPRAVLIREESVSAAELFPDRSLDFVYIDAAHLYEDVKRDIYTWAPKVREGGILMGHDYTYGDMRVVDNFGNVLSTFRIEVRQAVDEWAYLYGKKVDATTEANFKSWLVRM